MNVMEYSSETLLESRERFIGKQRDEWSLDDWRRTVDMLAMALDVQIKLTNEANQCTNQAIQHAEYFRDKEPPKPRRGRPRRRPGLWMVKGPRKSLGRKPEKNRRQNAIIVYQHVQIEKELLRSKGKESSDKAALESILRTLASKREGPSRRKSIGSYIAKRYGRFRKLLTEGKKIVSESD